MAVPERVRWAVVQLSPGPDEQLLEIGCGPGVAVVLICERLAGGRIVAIDRSATAISRATQRNAEHIAVSDLVDAAVRVLILYRPELVATSALNPSGAGPEEPHRSN